MAVSRRLAAQFRGCPPNSKLWPSCIFTLCHELPDCSGCEALSRQAAKACCGTSEASVRENHGPQGISQDSSQELLWHDLFSNPTQWWDNRRSKETPRHPDFRHKRSKEALWLNSRGKPAWVDSRLGMQEAQRSGSVSILVKGDSGKVAPHEGDIEVRTCRQLCEDGRISEAVDGLDLLVQQERHVPHYLFYRVLKRCTAQRALVLGRRVHTLTVQSGYAGNAFLATHLITLYASYGALEEAMRVFSTVSTPDAYNWASIILAYARHGEPTEAIRLYRQMLETAVKPDNCTFVAILKACGSAGDLAAGKDVHAHLLASAGKPDMLVQNCLVDMYAKCRSLEDARSVFDSLPHKDVVTWTSIIAGYAQQGLGEEALRLYNNMEDEGMSPPDSFTFACLLQACATGGVAALKQGKKLHAQMEESGVQTDVVVGNSLVNMYVKCGSLEDAQRVFDTLSRRDVLTWNAMIAGYVQQGMGLESLSLYSRMQQEGIVSPNAVTFVCLLQACAGIGVAALQQGIQLHGEIEERGLQNDAVVGNTLISMFAKCGSLQDAQRVFDRLSPKNVVTWTAMIAGYAQQGLGQEALSLYSRMQQEGLALPDVVTFVCLLQACAGVGAPALDHGRQLHAQIEERGLQADVVVGGSLVNMYAHCGSLEDASRVFDRLPEKNVVTWNAMIAGYVQQGMVEEALDIYSSMRQEPIHLPDSVTFVCLLHACATAAALPLGKQLHALVEEQGLQADVVVGSSLVCMYAKCGSMVDSQQVFDSLPQRETAAWSALVAGYTRQGDSEAVFALLDKMRMDGIQPNGIILLNVLTVCSHAGLVDKGRKCFEEMVTDYGITPTIEHYTCMVDLVGRAGYLDEALQMVQTMPYKPDGAVWRTLLGACQKWNNVEVGQQAFEFAVRLDERDAAAFVLMSNIYAGAEMWEEAKKLQARRVKSRAYKEPGQSWWTDTGGVTHEFVVGSSKYQEGTPQGFEELCSHGS